MILSMTKKINRNKNNLQDIEKYLETTILSPAVDKAALGDVIRDYGELAIDTLLTNGLLKEIPLIKTVAAIPQIINDFNNQMLIKKIVHFLLQLGSTSFEERVAFLNTLDGDKRIEIISNLVLVLGRYEHTQKAELHGRIFAAYVKNEINYFEYMSLVYAITMINVKLLPDLIRFYTVETSVYPPIERIYNLMFLQLIRIDNSPIGTYGGKGPTYKKNKLGMLMVEIGCQTKIPQDYKDIILGKVSPRR
jgi:hypothetical protein